MKTSHARLTMFILALIGGWNLGDSSAMADLEVSASVRINAAADFYEPLTVHGAWIEAGGYGRCWRPTGVAAGWRPYCDGYWVWTDCGWYWQSDEPWAWACYHYGYWVCDSDYGWIWIPGVEWAPAWVSWRIGGGYIGWAPCSAHGVVVNTSAFVFVGEDHFQERHRASTLIVNNPDIVHQTKQVARGKRESRDVGGRQQTVVINAGPDVKTVEKTTGKKFTMITIQEADRHTIVPAAVKQRHDESPDVKKTPAATEPVRSDPGPRVVPSQPPSGSGAPSAWPGDRGGDRNNKPDQGHDKDRDRDRGH